MHLLNNYTEYLLWPDHILSTEDTVADMMDKILQNSHFNLESLHPNVCVSIARGGKTDGQLFLKILAHLHLISSRYSSIFFNFLPLNFRLLIWVDLQGTNDLYVWFTFKYWLSLLSLLGSGWEVYLKVIVLVFNHLNQFWLPVFRILIQWKV